MLDKLGICQWFHYRDYATVKQSVQLLRELGVRHLRTGVSWADYHRPEGKEWYQWLLEELKEFEILLSVWHTPPSIAEGSICAGPPKQLLDYADFIGELIERFGDCFYNLELWNEPNNRFKWDFVHLDPNWEKFGKMIAAASRVANVKGKPTVLGGMIPVDHHWLQLMHDYGAIQNIDVIAIHGFPEMWWPNHPNWDWAQHWRGWAEKVNYIQPYTEGRPVWITETGLATWDLDQNRSDRFELQQAMLHRAADAPVDRVYWYSLIDLAPYRDAIEGFHVDENEYHLGLVTYRGQRKPAFEDFRQLLRDASYIDLTRL